MIGVLFNTYVMYKIFRYETFEIKNSHLIIFLSFNLTAAVTVLVYIFLCGMLCSVPYVLCAFWLAGVAYADYVSCNVYEIMEYYAVIPVALSVMHIMHGDITYTMPKLAAALATVTVYKIMGKAGVYGEGDSDILSVVCVVYFDAYYNCIFFGLAMLIFVFRNFGYAVRNRGRRGGIRPLIPSLYMAYILMLPFVTDGCTALKI